MPHIDVLPNSTSISAPGWAYVPDTGYDPSKAAIQPSGARKRAARISGLGGGDTTTRQNNAIQKHLADLDKDNHKEVQIAVPARNRDAAGRVSKGKVSQAARRILMSQKTFANHLADEEAAIAAGEFNLTESGSKTPSYKVVRTPVALPMHQPTSIPTPTSSTNTQGRAESGTASTDTGMRTPSTVTHPPQVQECDEPLLKSYVPSPPSEALMESLMSAPPLSYNAARAVASSSGRPQRHFCEICGFWGRVKCLKCGARVCSLDCKTDHDEGRCLKFYA